MATGSGKTTVMAMIIAWQTVNAVRRPQSRAYGRWAFLELRDPSTMRQDFAHYIKEAVAKGQKGYGKTDG